MPSGATPFHPERLLTLTRPTAHRHRITLPPFLVIQDEASLKQHLATFDTVDRPPPKSSEAGFFIPQDKPKIRSAQECVPANLAPAPAGVAVMPDQIRFAVALGAHRQRRDWVLLPDNSRREEASRVEASCLPNVTMCLFTELVYVDRHTG